MSLIANVSARVLGGDAVSVVIVRIKTSSDPVDLVPGATNSGVVLNAGDRVFVYASSSLSDGIWVVGPTRASDFPVGFNATGKYVYVSSGTHVGTSWLLSGTVGNLSATQILKSGTSSVSGSNTGTANTLVQ